MNAQVSSSVGSQWLDHRALQSNGSGTWRSWTATMATVAVRQVLTSPGSVLRGVCIAWMVLLGFFAITGPLCNAVAYWTVGWTRTYGYATGDFGPFYVAALVVSCTGFLLAGYAVARMSRTTPEGPVVSFALSVFVAIAASVGIVLRGPTPVNHTWFFVMWTALPFTLYVGVLVNPALVLVGGWLGMRPRHTR